MAGLREAMEVSRMKPVAFCLLAAAVSAAWAQPPQGAPSANPVAGLAPHERPLDAPAIAEFVRSPEWRQRALHGVSQPVPPSLGFLDSQGAWYNPFLHPGMVDRYDLRGWHARSAR